MDHVRMCANIMYIWMDIGCMYVCMYKYIYIVGWMMNGCVDA